MASCESVIVALDFPDAREAEGLVERLADRVDVYKVGLQLLTAAGPGLVSGLVGAGKAVFLDLKLHEIPNSVAGAVRACGTLGVSMVSVHASAGAAVLEAAVEAAAETPRLRVLALTVITSLTDESLAEVGVSGGVAAQVRRLTSLAAGSGCHGVVTSPREVALCRELLPPPALVVVPGVSVSLGARDPRDHARYGTVASAIADGATHVVLGRSVTEATDPTEVVAQAVKAVDAGRQLPTS
jgi:orotidine-5'-phosphate decarboxylase